MRLTSVSLALATLLGAVAAPSFVWAADKAKTSAPSGKGQARVKSVEFIGMDAPSTAEQKADMYTAAKMKVTYANGKTVEHALHYHKLFDTTDRLGGQLIGGILNAKGELLNDNPGAMAYDAPDGTSLMKIDGLNVPGAKGNPLALVHQFEYKALPPEDGVSKGEFWSKLPAGMALTLLDQDKKSGLLSPKSYQPVDFSGVHGGWIHCGSTLSAWNTHIGSEEYEPDAKVRGGGAKQSTAGLVASDDATDINSFSKYYFGDAATANPYHYGLVPEVTVSKDGKASVVKHYATGRFAREMQIGADDNKTFIGGDDGKNTGLFMFVADHAKDLSAGTIYAAKVTQTSAALAGEFKLSWVRLGQGTDAQIKAYVDRGIVFADMFDVSNTDPSDASYTRLDTYNGTEWLRLKAHNSKGMSAAQIQQAAAFLETRRYAALMGATTEFTKMEYIAYNKADKKFYVVISRIEASMADKAGDIQVARNDGGAILEMSTAASQTDSTGNPIASAMVGTTLKSVPELVGGWNGDAKDADGNQCSQDKICGPDNIVYVDSARTLLIGEDTSRRNNNYVWAYNVDSKKLSRILSTPTGAEATGLFAATYNGYSYIMSNFQHPGEFGSADRDWSAIKPLLDSRWGNRKKAALGYIGTRDGALPALN